MSYNAKNLSYNPKEPVFLRRLRAQHGSGDSARHERPLARPKKQVKDGEEDDQPTYVLEGSQDTISKAECETLMGTAYHERRDENETISSAKPDLGAQKPAKGASDVSEDVAPVKQKIAAIGSSNKRRLAKVVGEADDVDGDPDVKGNCPTPNRKKHKTKKVKLSFNEGPPEF
ncbi:hypothetical protein N7G274_000084 [Stereocaulon virgatum]|uniref:DUF4604 domain-containing protein n=1 Tax=Stereocaulon virgatum TaxID=373712 RepID=A0ABR4AXI2_9LECA